MYFRTVFSCHNFQKVNPDIASPTTEIVENELFTLQLSCSSVLVNRFVRHSVTRYNFVSYIPEFGIFKNSLSILISGVLEIMIEQEM